MGELGQKVCKGNSQAWLYNEKCLGIISNILVPE